MDKHQEQGRTFHVAGSVDDLRSSVITLGSGADILLARTSLRAIEEPEHDPGEGGAGQWYQVSDPTGSIDLYWPALSWRSSSSGLTPEMRECGQFFASTLELRYRHRGDRRPVIVRVVRREGKQPVRRRFSWIRWFVPRFDPLPAGAR